MVDTNTCERCGAEMHTDDSRCVTCGFVNGKPCSSCETLMPLSARICTACGSSFDRSTSSEKPTHTNGEPVGEHQVTTAEQHPKQGLDEVPPIKQDASTAATRLIPMKKRESKTPHDADYELEAGQPGSGQPGSGQPGSGQPGSGPPEDDRGDPVLELDSDQLLEPTGNTVRLDHQAPPPASQENRKTTRILEDDYETILATCKKETAAGTRLAGLFGRPEAGKTSFIYSVGKVIQGGRSQGALSQYSIDGNWKQMLGDMDHMFESGQQTGTERGLHPYKGRPVHRGRGTKPFLFLDIRGEQFEQISDWSEEVTHFFITYLRQCQGFFLFLDIDEDTLAPSKVDVLDRRARSKGSPLTEVEKQLAIRTYNNKANQMAHMVSFLSVAAQVPRVDGSADLQAQKSDLMKATREENIGRHTLDIPVALCISKADRLKDFKFRDYPALIPGADSIWGDPWEVIREIWGGHLASMQRIVPHLKVEWVSSLGENFRPERGMGRPRGVDAVFDFVLGSPPPSWALASRKYFQWRRWLKV